MSFIFVMFYNSTARHITVTDITFAYFGSYINDFQGQACFLPVFAPSLQIQIPILKYFSSYFRYQNSFHHLKSFLFFHVTLNVSLEV